MTSDGSTSQSGGRSGSGGATADSYIGSVISLTSKSEIRYEGILYNINTDESSIGLRNVRSFGTEGRKKDGPQVPPSDKIYEYILFRGSDIKDLQVKASAPAQPAPPINNDPAIIQSHFTHPTGQSSNLAAPGGNLPDHSSNSSQIGIPGSSFQGGLPLYQPGGNLNSWGPSPQNANPSGLGMPMYWQGFYGTPGGIPQLPQQSLVCTPPGFPIPPTMQQMQFPGFRSPLPMAMPNLPNLPTTGAQDHHLVPTNMVNSSSVTSNLLPLSSLPLSIPPMLSGLLASESSSSFFPNKVPISAVAAPIPTSSLPTTSQLPSSISGNSGDPPASIKTAAIPGFVALSTQQNAPIQGKGVGTAAAASSASDVPIPQLITPGQLLPPAASSSTAQILQTSQKDVEVVQVSPKRTSEPSISLEPEAQPPLLPLPSNTRTYKSNGSPQNVRNNTSRARGGRVYATSRSVTKFTEDFDFTAMNEKFDKDEVWGHLGKGNNKSQSKDKEVYEIGDNEEVEQEEDEGEVSKIEVKSVYNKDDFFDTLSCNALDNDPNHGRTRYSEQMKLDTETFGDFSRYRGRGGRGPYRGGGGRYRGSFQGRGSYGGGGGSRSYGYMPRGRGRGVQSRGS